MMKRLMAILAIAAAAMHATIEVEKVALPPNSGPTRLDLAAGLVDAAVAAVPEIASAIRPGDVAGTVSNVAAATVTILKGIGVFE